MILLPTKLKVQSLKRIEAIPVREERQFACFSILLSLINIQKFMVKKDSSVYEYSAGFITFKSEGYFFVQMKENSFSTKETVQESDTIMTRLQPEGPVYIIVDVASGSDGEEGLREHIATSLFGKRVSAQALVVHELAARLMGNLFLRYFKRKKNMRIFSKESDARTWLLECMKDLEKEQQDTKKMTLVI